MIGYKGYYHNGKKTILGMFHGFELFSYLFTVIAINTLIKKDHRIFLLPSNVSLNAQNPKKFFQ